MQTNLLLLFWATVGYRGVRDNVETGLFSGCKESQCYSLPFVQAVARKY